MGYAKVEHEYGDTGYTQRASVWWMERGNTLRLVDGRSVWLRDQDGAYRWKNDTLDVTPPDYWRVMLSRLSDGGVIVHVGAMNIHLSDKQAGLLRERLGLLATLPKPEEAWAQTETTDPPTERPRWR